MLGVKGYIHADHFQPMSERTVRDTDYWCFTKSNVSFITSHPPKGITAYGKTAFRTDLQQGTMVMKIKVVNLTYTSCAY